VEQAYKGFEKGTFQNKSEGFKRLMKIYISEVFPDRRGIITSGLKVVSSNRQNVLKSIDCVVAFLEEKVKYQNLKYERCIHDTSEMPLGRTVSEMKCRNR